MMKKLFSLLAFGYLTVSAQNLGGIQLFNPQTNDETPVIGFNEKLILKFDDFSNSVKRYRYTIKHLDRNWQEDNLFFTEMAEGNMNALIEDYSYSFNTYQKYVNYRLSFPNDKIRPKISGNFELIIYLDSPEKPVFTKKFSVSEDQAKIGIDVSRFSSEKNPELNQRVEVRAVSQGINMAEMASTMSLTLVQNNNRNLQLAGKRSNSVSGNQILFQGQDLVFPGNNEFYYFDNKNIDQPFDMIAEAKNVDGIYQNYLYPVWAFPLNYQYQPDVNGAFYFRRNDLGIERDADKEGDYSWVYFALYSEKTDKEIYVLGGFNDYISSKENQMHYDENSKKYIAKIYLKQGFYNYILATKNPNGTLNFGEINGNFWQTENLYQAYLYYTPFGKNYDALAGYGEYRTPVR